MAAPTPVRRPCITAGDPGQLIERAALLEAAGSHRSDVLDRVTVLQERATAADAVARETVATAEALQEHAKRRWWWPRPRRWPPARRRSR